jgi:hypothetical protein
MSGPWGWAGRHVEEEALLAPLAIEQQLPYS